MVPDSERLKLKVIIQDLTPRPLRGSLCTLQLCRSVYLHLLDSCNTRYGWLARPCPAGTFTPLDTPSFPRRDNALNQRRLHAAAFAAGKRPLDLFVMWCPSFFLVIFNRTFCGVGYYTMPFNVEPGIKCFSIPLFRPKRFVCVPAFKLIFE